MFVRTAKILFDSKRFFREKERFFALFGGVYGII